ncbi:potassium channel family protein [Polynucleobacter acidiphobus]|uniref:potassium channel family protein n=1 Tax=Polynucleobacter acidiphobus TaxID=556053 RepID=UPI001900FD95|nr:potassium channel family protein [Polynucleobacter acidiphobus]
MTTFILNALVALLAIVFHYEVLYRLNNAMPAIKHIHARYKVLIAVGVIFIAHIAEIWIFALAYYFMLQFPTLGSVIGAASDHGLLLDSAYLSFVTYTTVGYGDIVVDGYLRYLTGIEALTGLILITWSASFLFIEMQKYWGSSELK